MLDGLRRSSSYKEGLGRRSSSYRESETVEKTNYDLKQLNELHALGTKVPLNDSDRQFVHVTNTETAATTDQAAPVNLRVKSVSRANPLYRGSVYEEADKFGTTNL
jgi:hypothetical protein